MIEIDINKRDQIAYQWDKEGKYVSIPKPLYGEILSESEHQITIRLPISWNDALEPNYIWMFVKR